MDTVKYKTPYRLIDVLDHEGNSKADSQTLYRERVGCVTTALEVLPRGEGCVAYMDFIEDPQGQMTNLRLRTSPVSNIQESDGKLSLHTANSIYLFEAAQLCPSVYQEEADLIELYLNGRGNQFCRGFYYDMDRKPHELRPYDHIGMLADSCLILAKEDPKVCLCRYFIQSSTVEFYDTLYGHQDYSRRLLIHNVGKQELCVHFQWNPTAAKILPPGEKYLFIPGGDFRRK